jgi:omega-6 fatty acid desaturase (delta-12 desaturase)
VLEHAYPQVKLPPGDRRATRFSTLITLIATGAFVASLYLVLGFWGVARCYGVPVVIAAVIGALITYLHHSSADSGVFDELEWTPMRGQVLTTYEVRFPRLLEWLWCDINLHLPHHLAPRIPWYHLRAASESIRRAYPAYHQQRPFRWSDLVRAWKRPLLQRLPNEELYVMTGSDR